MKKKTVLWYLLGIVSLIVVAVVMSLSQPASSALVFAVIPVDEAALTEEQYVPLIEYLSKELGVEVQLMTVTDYTAVVEALKYGHADMAYLGAASYVMATEEASIEAIVVTVKEASGSSYKAVILTRADSGITDLNGVSIAYTDVGSTSGYLVPSAYIAREGIEPSDVFFVGSQSAIVEAVRNSSVDVGCMADFRYHTAIEEGVIAEGDFVILWQSDPIPAGPITVQSSMDTELKAQLTALLLNMPPEIVEPLDTKIIGYAPVTDSDYDSIREISKDN